MKLSLSWLKDYIEIKESPDKLSEDLQFTGTKVDSIEKKNNDVIFDLEITPNRADCLGVIGIAREISAIYRRKLLLPQVFSQTKQIKKLRNVKITVEKKNLCPFYTIGVIDSIKVEKSPVWIRKRLEDSGIRSLNNVIDITNYAMLETGQPMHAFDADKIVGNMNLRLSKKGESLVTLDGIEREIPEESIIIEDEEKIIDLAGLMGGESSEIDDNTKTVILHVPVYHQTTIRHTSQALGLRTEASGRFEKQLDPAAHRFAFERATELLRILSRGRLVSNIFSAGYPVKNRFIEFEISFIQKILGINIDEVEIKEILENLNFTIQTHSNWANKFIKVGIPTFRTDIKQAIDLVEEVGRIYGYNNFPKTLPSGSPPQKFNSNTRFDNELKKILTSTGLDEVYGNPLTSINALEGLGIRSEKCLKVENRLVADYEYLRPTLLTSLIDAVKQNQEISNKFSFFELGTTFTINKGQNNLPNQPKKLGIVFVGHDFTYVKGVLDFILDGLGISGIKIKEENTTFPFSRPTISILLGNKTAGTLGFIPEEHLSKLGVELPLFAMELDLETLKNNCRQTLFKKIPKYPTVKENISLFIPNEVNYDDIHNTIIKSAEDNLYNLWVLEDVFIKGRRSMLLGIEYFHPKKTLKRQEITKIRNKILGGLGKIGVTVRS